MKLKDALILGLMGISCPLLLTAATLSSRAECQIDMQAKVVRPIGYRSDFQWLFIVAGLAQGAMAASLFRSHRRNDGEDDRPSFAAVPDVPRLPQPSAEVAVMPMRAELEPVPMTATLAAGQPIAVPQPQAKVTIPPEFHWFKDLIHYPAVLIYGAQGSGKTSFASYLLRQRIRAGHSAEVWDPHKKFGHWEGLPSYGAGMNYDAIDRRMQRFAQTVKDEYAKYANDPDYKAKKHSVVAEEVTNWGSRCENSGEFFTAALSDIRKIGQCVVFVAHDRTLTALGNAKGVSKARDAGMLELELLAKVDSQTGEPVPALKGRLKYPGKDPIEVQIAEWMKGEMNFTDLVQVATSPPETPIASPEQQDIRAKLEGLISQTPAPETVSEPNTNAETVSEPEPSDEVASEVRIDADTISKLFPDTTEYEVFTLIQQGYEIRLSPSDIVKKQLKLTQPDRYLTGKAIAVHLVRKYGKPDLILHFRKWLED